MAGRVAGTNGPRQPPTVTLQKVLPFVTDHELAAVTFAVDLGAPVPVHDLGPELVSGRRVRHDGITSARTQFELMSCISA